MFWSIELQIAEVDTCKNEPPRIAVNILTNRIPSLILYLPV